MIYIAAGPIDWESVDLGVTTKQEQILRKAVLVPLTLKTGFKGSQKNSYTQGQQCIYTQREQQAGLTTLNNKKVVIIQN